MIYPQVIGVHAGGQDDDNWGIVGVTFKKDNFTKYPPDPVEV